MNDSMVYGDFWIELKCEPQKTIKSQALTEFIAEYNFTNATEQNEFEKLKLKLGLLPSYLFVKIYC